MCKLERMFKKTETTLANQLSSVETRLGVQLSPPHSDINILKTTIADLKARYPKRYSFYFEHLKREAQEKSGLGTMLGVEEARRMKNWLLALNSMDEYIFNHKTGNERTLREKQLPIFEAIREYFEQGGSKGYVKLPTGTGKTVIFSELIEAANLKTLIVVPREILLEQTRGKLSQFAPELDTGLVYARIKEIGRKVTIITYDSFVAGLKNRLIHPEEFDLLVLDEVHRSLSENRKKAIERFPHALKIGFTATPEFSEKKRVDNILPDCIIKMSIREAVERGMLCSFVSGIIETQIDLSGVKLTAEGEYNEKMLEKAVDIESRNRAAVEVYKQLTPGKKAVAYCVGIGHARHAADKFLEAGIPAAAIWGAMPASERTSILNEYNKGNINVLCNSDLLIEGFDDPTVRLCVNLRPTRSRVIAEQRGGRALRLDENNPDKVGYIVDFLDHKGESGLGGAILFSEVAGQVYGRGGALASNNPLHTEEKTERDSSENELYSTYPELNKINLEGMKVTFDIREILKIVQKRAEDVASKNESRYLSYNAFIIAVRTAGVTSVNEYKIQQKLHPDWPSTPHDFYRDEWKGWGVITGNSATKERVFLSYDEFVIAVKAADVIDVTDFNLKRKQHPEWPSTPHVHYHDVWKGWSEITGNIQGKNRSFLSYHEFIAATKAAGVKNKTDYKKLRKQHPEWPSTPDTAYPDQWKGFKDITGNTAPKERVFLSYDELIAAAKAAGVVNAAEYRKLKKLHTDWPSNPEEIYADQWTRWSTITGNISTEQKKFLSYDDFVKAIQASEITGNIKKWFNKAQKLHPEWPSAPERIYPQWRGWGTILQG